MAKVLRDILEVVRGRRVSEFRDPFEGSALTHHVAQQPIPRRHEKRITVIRTDAAISGSSDPSWYNSSSWIPGWTATQ